MQVSKRVQIKTPINHVFLLLHFLSFTDWTENHLLTQVFEGWFVENGPTFFLTQQTRKIS